MRLHYTGEEAMSQSIKDDNMDDVENIAVKIRSSTLKCWPKR